MGRKGSLPANAIAKACQKHSKDYHPSTILRYYFDCLALASVKTPGKNARGRTGRKIWPNCWQGSRQQSDVTCSNAFFFMHSCLTFDICRFTWFSLPTVNKRPQIKTPCITGRFEIKQALAPNLTPATPLSTKSFDLLFPAMNCPLKIHLLFWRIPCLR